MVTATHRKIIILGEIRHLAIEACDGRTPLRTRAENDEFIRMK